MQPYATLNFTFLWAGMVVRPSALVQQALLGEHSFRYEWNPWDWCLQIIPDQKRIVQ